MSETAGTLTLGAKTVTGVTSFSVTGTGIITFSSVAMSMSSDLTVNTSGAVTAGAAITMTGVSNLAISTGPIGDLVIANTVTVTASGAGQDVGALSFTAGSLAVNGGVNFQAASAIVSQNVTVGNLGIFSTVGALTVNAGVSVSAAGTSGAITVGNTLTVNGTGSVVVNSGTLTVSAGGLSIVAAGGSVSSTAAGAINVTGAATSAGTITGNTGGMSFSSTLSSTGAFNLGTGIVTVSGAASITAGTLDFNVGNSQLVLGDNLTLNAALAINNASSTDLVVFTGALAQQLNTGGKNLPSMQVNKSGGSLTLVGNNLVHIARSSVSFTCTVATAFNLNALNWTLPGALTVNNFVTLNVNTGSLLGGQDLTVTGTGVVNHTTGVITVGNYTHSGAGADALGTGNITIGAQLQVSAGSFTQAGATAGAQAVNNILINGGSCTWGSGALTLAGGVSVTSGSLNLSAKALSGVTSFSVTGTGIITFSSVAMSMSSDLTVNTSGAVTVGAAITMTGVSNLAISTGPIGDLVIANAVTVTASGAGQDVGALSFTAGSLTVNGGVNFQAASAIVSQNVTVGNLGIFSTVGALTVNAGVSVSAAGTSGAITVGNTLTVNGTGSVVVNSGTLTVSAGGLSIVAAGGSVSSTGAGAINVTWGCHQRQDITGNTGGMSFSSTLSSTGAFNLGTGIVTVSGAASITAGTLDFNVGNSQLVLGDNLTLNAALAINNASSTDLVVFTGALAQQLNTGGKTFRG